MDRGEGRKSQRGAGFIAQDIADDLAPARVEECHAGKYNAGSGGQRAEGSGQTSAGAGNPKELTALEQANFGKYWQTVRGGSTIRLDPALAGTEIEQTIEAIREIHPEKGVYGGSGWANYAACYFNDCQKLAVGLKSLLKPRATALVVIGNSIVQGISVPTDRYFGLIAEQAGLQLAEIHIPRETRVGNSIIQSDVRVKKAAESHQLYEAVVELKKP